MPVSRRSVLAVRRGSNESRGWPAMRPWVGAVAVVAAMLTAPGTALAGEDDPALVQFELPSKAAIPAFEALGADMDHALGTARDGGVLVSAWVTDAEQARYAALGYRAVATVHDKFNIDRIRAERNRTLAAEAAARDALKTNAAGVKGASARPGIVRAQRADYFENNVGRFISIEAQVLATQSQLITCTNPTAGTGCSYTGPALAADVYDAAGTRVGGGNLTTYIDPDVNPDYYQYHYQVFRLGNKGDGGVMPASIKVAGLNGDVDTLAVKEWIAKTPPGYAAGFKKDFITHYYDSQEAYKKMRDLAAEFPNISQVYDLPEKTTGYQRKAQTILGQTALYTNQTTVPTADQPRAVILTSNAYGQDGGNLVSGRLINPGANSS